MANKQNNPPPPAEIPASGISTVQQLLESVNDFILDCLSWVQGGFVANPAQKDVDANQKNIVNLADPRDSQDAVNLRTLQKAVQGVAPVSIPAPVAQHGGGGGTTIITQAGAPAVKFIFGGDSRVRGGYHNASYPAGSYPGQIQSMLGVDVTNFGADGACSGPGGPIPGSYNTTYGFIANQLPKIIAACDPTLLNIVVIGPLGVNDWLLGADNTVTQANMTTIVAALQTLSGTLNNVKVVLCTEPPSNYTGGVPAGFQGYRTAYNAWLIANSIAADAVVGLDSDTRFNNLGAPPWSTFPALYYYTDHLHFTEAGYAVIAEDVAEAIMTLTGLGAALGVLLGGSSSPTVLSQLNYNKRTTTPYTLTATDFSVNMSCGATPATATLPAAAGVPKQIFAISNTGSVNLTVGVTGGDTIAGSLSTVSISPGCTEIYESDGGTNWLILAYSVFVQGDGVGVLAVTTANGVTISLTGAQQYTKKTTTPYTIAATDYTVNMSCGATPATATMPSVAAVPKQIYAITNTGSVNLTVARAGSDTFGTAGATSVTISPGCTDFFQSDGGTNWLILGFDLLMTGTAGQIGVSLNGNTWTFTNLGVTSVNGVTGAVTLPSGPTSWAPTLTMTGGVLTGGSAIITATYALLNLFPFIQFNGTFIVSSVSSSVNSFNITLPGGLGAGTPAGVVLYGSIFDVTAGAAVVNTGVLLTSSTVAAIGLSIPAVAGHTYTVWIGGWYYA